jgi:hypothetical protein
MLQVLQGPNNFLAEDQSAGLRAAFGRRNATAARHASLAHTRNEFSAQAEGAIKHTGFSVSPPALKLVVSWDCQTNTHP